MGRHTSYKDEYADLAFKYCLLGATNPQLAKNFGVADSTIDLWIKDKSKFSGAVKEGREEADAKVADSLYHRALGYTVEEDKIFCNTNGEVTTVRTVKNYPPDATSAIFWLKNRQRAKWREKIDVEHGGNVTIAATALDEAI